MGGPAGVKEQLGASRGLRTNRRLAGFRKPMGAQQEAEGQKDPKGQEVSRCEKANGRSQQALEG